VQRHSPHQLASWRSLRRSTRKSKAAAAAVLQGGRGALWRAHRHHSRRQQAGAAGARRQRLDGGAGAAHLHCRGSAMLHSLRSSACVWLPGHDPTPGHVSSRSVMVCCAALQGSRWQRWRGSTAGSPPWAVRRRTSCWCCRAAARCDALNAIQLLLLHRHSHPLLCCGAWTERPPYEPLA
jgi:hypothetical protein